MRRLLLAVPLACLPLAAQAAMPVIDLTAVNQAIQEVEQLKQEVQTMRGVFGALAHPSDILGATAGLNGNSLGQVLPNGQELQADVSGTGDGGALAGQSQQYLQQDQVYKTSDTDFQAQMMVRAAQRNANIRALAQNASDALQQRATGIDDLSQRLSTAKDVTDFAALQDRLQVEQNRVADIQAQIPTLYLMAQQQEKVDQEQQLENRRKSIDDYFNATQPGGAGSGAGGGAPASPCPLCG
ncbi:MAG: hypothetical protein JOY66_18695 [Acetobacteraceae bacterium]|nr:hypothetical protein [Acetobacteraceae bacterium]